MAKVKPVKDVNYYVLGNREYWNWEDEQEFLKRIFDHAGCECGKGARVYEHEGVVIVCCVDITPKEVFRIAHEYLWEIGAMELEQATREAACGAPNERDSGSR